VQRLTCGTAFLATSFTPSSLTGNLPFGFTRMRLIAIPNAELQRWWGPRRDGEVQLLDVFDGAQPMSTPFRPNVSQSPDGRLWFANESVVQMIDPAHLDGNPIPPVHIEQVTADRKIYWQNWSAMHHLHLKLPPLVRDLTIDYTALSLVAPRRFTSASS